MTASVKKKERAQRSEELKKLKRTGNGYIADEVHL